MSWDFMTSLASFADETTRVGIWPSLRSMRGPYLSDRDATERCGRLPSWWRLPIIGSCGGDGGKALVLLVEKSLSESRKRKRKRKRKRGRGA